MNGALEEVGMEQNVVCLESYLMMKRFCGYLGAAKRYSTDLASCA